MLREPSKTKDNIINWIREYFASSVPNAYAVIGISGGKDSSVAAALCAEALGADRVVGVKMCIRDRILFLVIYSCQLAPYGLLSFVQPNGGGDMTAS